MSGTPTVEERLRSALEGDAERLHPSPVPPPELRPRVRRRAMFSVGMTVAVVVAVVAGAVVAVDAARRATPPEPGTTTPANPTPAIAAPCTAWSVVPAPGHEAEGFDTNLMSVTAPSPGVALAVGIANERELNGPMQLELQRWDGTRWSRLPAPETRSHGNGPVLEAVDASSDDSAWAVGSLPLSRGRVPLALRWDGASWDQVAVPDDPATEAGFSGVADIGTDDAWAVGSWGPPDASPGGPLVAHWDGTTWSVTHLPTTDRPEGTGSGQHDGLHGVDGASADDVWAVGTEFDWQQTFERTLIEHWDGTSWQRVPSPNVPPTDAKPTMFNALEGVTAVGPDDAWAVGTYWQRGAQGRPTIEGPLVLHWDGTGWSIMPIDGIFGGLSAVAAASANDAWAVGSALTGSDARTVPVLEHWDGRSWTAASPPTDDSANLLDVAAIPGGGFWTVGRPVAQGAHESLQPPVAYRCR